MGVDGPPLQQGRLDLGRLTRLLPDRITRRHVIAGALATGAGVTALRLLGLDRKVDEVRRAVVAKAAQAPAAATVDWSSPLGTESARIAHLLRRTTFGAGPADFEAAASLGYSKLVDQLVETPPAQPPPVPGMGPNDGIDIGKLQQWWVDHMLATPTPFAERMTLFLHGHFTSDYLKVGTDEQYLYWQNLTWRNMAMTDLGSMLMKVTTDPAMMVYLDLATSTGKNPNENYARELMELFTLGAGAFGEGDVRAAARGLAGWKLPAGTGRVGVFDKRRAYTGPPLTFLGRTGPLDTNGVIQGILASPTSATYLVTKVLYHFVTPSPAAGYVQRLADEFRTSGFDMKTLMRSVFLSPEFIEPQSYRALVKTPTEYMLSAAKALGARQLSSTIVDAASDMGQILFDPPDVGGWPNNDAWISSNTIISRVNFVTNALSRLGRLPSSKDVHQVQLDGVLSPATAKLLGQTPDDRTRWTTALMSPEFNLK